MINEMDENMTVFYNKRTGEIIAYTGGETNMAYFGDLEEDYVLIYDYMVVELDLFFMEHFEQFNVLNNKLRYVQPEVPSKFLGEDK